MSARMNCLLLPAPAWKKNQADYIVANDLLDIKEGQHRAYLVSKNEHIQVETKDQIAQLILQVVTNQKEA